MAKKKGIGSIIIPIILLLTNIPFFGLFSSSSDDSSDVNIEFSADKQVLSIKDPMVNISWNVTGTLDSVSISGIGTVQNKGTKQIRIDDKEISISVSSNGKPITKKIEFTLLDNSSCNTLLLSDEKLKSGVYDLQPNEKVIKTWCEMTNDGGWTLIGAQFESNPISWKGDFSAYDPTLQSGKSFAFSDENIPEHVDFAIGKSLSIVKKISNFKYSTTDIPKIIVNGYDNNKYWIHRSYLSYYPAHNPAQTLLATKKDWYNSLTIELINNDSNIINHYTWAFSPMNSAEQQRGYSLERSLVNSYIALNNKEVIH